MLYLKALYLAAMIASVNEAKLPNWMVFQYGYYMAEADTMYGWEPKRGELRMGEVAHDALELAPVGEIEFDSQEPAVHAGT